MHKSCEKVYSSFVKKKKIRKNQGTRGRCWNRWQFVNEARLFFSLRVRPHALDSEWMRCGRGHAPHVAARVCQTVTSPSDLCTRWRPHGGEGVLATDCVASPEVLWHQHNTRMCNLSENKFASSIYSSKAPQVLCPFLYANISQYGCICA